MIHFLIQYIFLLKGTRKTLILREIPEGDVRSLLNNKESLAPCDAAVFVYDRYAFCWAILLFIHDKSASEKTDNFSYKLPFLQTWHRLISLVSVGCIGLCVVTKVL
jgi:hypothetical protein